MSERERAEGEVYDVDVGGLIELMGGANICALLHT